MTQHHDPVHPDEPAGTPLHAADAPELSAADDAFLASVFAELPPITMPGDVVARITAALAAEPDLDLTGSAAGSTAAGAAAGAGTNEAFSAGATIVPLATAPRRANARILQVAAALVLVAAGSVFAFKNLGATEPTSVASAGSETAGGVVSGVPPRVTASGRDYTEANLGGIVSTYSTKGLGALSEAPSEPSTDVRAAELASDTTVLAACINAVQGNPVQPQPAIAIDVGTFNKKPAVVIVVQSTDAHILTTYVVGSDCGTNADPQILYFANVPRP